MAVSQSVRAVLTRDEGTRPRRRDPAGPRCAGVSRMSSNFRLSGQTGSAVPYLCLQRPVAHQDVMCLSLNDPPA